MGACRLTPYDTLDLFKNKSRPPGTYIQFVNIQGNSILTSIFVDAIASGIINVLWEEVIHTSTTKELISFNANVVGAREYVLRPFHTALKLTVTTTDTTEFTLKATSRTDSLIQIADLDFIPHGESFVVGKGQHKICGPMYIEGELVNSGHLIIQ